MEIKKLIPALLLLLLAIGFNSCSEDDVTNVVTDNEYSKICEKASDIDYTIVEEYYKKSESLDDLMKHADEIKAIDGVEDVYSNGTTSMFVKIKDFRTMSYSFYPEPVEPTIEQQQMMQSQIKAIAKAQNNGVVYNNQDKENIKVLIVNQQSQEDRDCQNNVIVPGIKERFEKAGFKEENIHVELSPNTEFFRNGIFDCDYLFLLTHGQYDSKTGLHWLMTSVSVPRDSKNRMDPTFWEQYKDYPEDQVRCDKNDPNGLNKVVVSEKFIETSSRQFNHPRKAIVFNTACESMRGPSTTEIDSINYSLSRVFELKGAGAYLGYDRSGGVGAYGGFEFWNRMLSGMSVKSAHDDLSFKILHDYEYDKDTGKYYWADLVLHAPQMKETSINQPEISYKDLSDDNGLRIDLSANCFFEHIYTLHYGIGQVYTSYDSGNNLFRYGFELSKTEDFANVISLGKEFSITDEDIVWDESTFGLSPYDCPCLFSLSQSLTYNVNESNTVIEPETTYWARAYVYDGKGYSYSRPISFTTGEYSRIDNVIPPEIRSQMDPYITIYDGNTPPNIEGEYLISPCELIYDSEYNYSPGHAFSDKYIKFYNQNMHSNTIDYMDKQSSSTSTGTGAFISGSGNNFSVFFNTEGVSHYSYDVYTKRALVVSGTKDEQGIHNLQYAFVIVDKSDDPNSYVIPVGGFRVIKDGDYYSPFTTWDAAKKYLRKSAGRPLDIERRKKK